MLGIIRDRMLVFVVVVVVERSRGKTAAVRGLWSTMPELDGLLYYCSGGY